MFVLNVFLVCSEVFLVVLHEIRAPYETIFTRYVTDNYRTVRYCDTLEHLIMLELIVEQPVYTLREVYSMNFKRRPWRTVDRNLSRRTGVIC